MKMLILQAVGIIGLCSSIVAGVNYYNCQVNSSTGEILSFCCDNHEEKDGKCIECQIGYKSIDGKPCATCPKSWWGRKCNTKCSCQKNERSFHWMNLFFSVIISLDEPILQCKVTEVKTYFHTRKIEDTTNQVFTDSINKDIHFIILYILLASSIVICIAVVFFCSKGHRFGMCIKPDVGQTHQPMQGQSRQPVQHNRSAEYIDVIDENAYESIEDVSTDDAVISVDASNMDGNNISVDNINGQNSTSDSSESIRVIDDGYLNPYNPLNDHIEKHDYKKIEPKLDIVVDREDNSSDSDKNSMDSSGYLKPVRIEETII